NAECEAAFTVVRGIKGELAADHPGAETFLISLADGAVLLDTAGKVVAKGEALDADCVGGSQSGLLRVSAGQVVPDDELEFLVYSSGGGHGDALVYELAVYKRRGDKLELILTSTVEGQEKDDTNLQSVGTLEQHPSGKKQTVLKRWDAAKFEF